MVLQIDWIPGFVTQWRFFYHHVISYGPLTRYVKWRVAHACRIRDRGMHHGTCVTHVLRCVSGSPIGGGENDPGIPSACATRNVTYLANYWIYWAFSLAPKQRTVNIQPMIGEVTFEYGSGICILLWILTLYVLNFAVGNINIYLHFISLLHIYMAQVLKILS